MIPNQQKEPPKLVEYFVICGVRQSDLVDYVGELSRKGLVESDFTAAALATSGFAPHVVSAHPGEKPEFPLSADFADVDFA